jgi:hypothetical protein
MKKIVVPVILSLCLTSTAFAWQQRVAYQIEARLDTVEHFIYASQNLRYFNNSPDTLRYVWFHLYPNAYRDQNTAFARESRANEDYAFWRSGKEARGYIEINHLGTDGQSLHYQYGDDLTKIKVMLPTPMIPGDSIDFVIEYKVKIPDFFSRMGHDGTHYEISQWYPKIAVYDQKGWHPDGYHYIGEFYGDYGSFDVGLTVPRSMKIGTTGNELTIPYDSMGLDSDSSIYHFYYADGVHDFAWCADPEYRETTEVYNGVTLRVLCTKKNVKKWKNVLQYAKDALDYHGRWYGIYPYAMLTVCEGDIRAGGGMEYPNMVIVSQGEDKITRTLESTVVHEIGHQWFYGLLGSNEMDEAWLDEGFTTFSEERYFREKYGNTASLWADKRLQKAMPGLNMQYIGQLLCHMYYANRMEQPVGTKASQSGEMMQYAVSAYFKPAQMLWWLREYLGDEMFNQVMQTYFRRGQMKHVTADDFYGVLDSVSGQSLSPVASRWITSIAHCDYSIDDASIRNNTCSFALNRYGDFKLPVRFQAVDQTGKGYDLTWGGLKRDTVIQFTMDAPFARAAIDPAGNVMDDCLRNNVWPRKISWTLLPRLPRFDAYQIFFVPLPWYDAVNGFRLGVISHGAYLADGDPMIGRHQWTFSPYYGFKSRQVSFSFDYQTPVASSSRPPRIYLSGGKAFDLRWAAVGLKRSWGKHLFLGPTERFDLKLEYNQMVDHTYRFWDERDIIPAKITMLTAERGYNTSRPYVRSDIRLAATLGYVSEPAWDIRNFMRTEVEHTSGYYICKWFKPNLRLFAGNIQGSAPRQEQYFLSGAFKSKGLDDMIISYKGWFSAQEQYHIDGGADIPGYYGRHLYGRAAFGINLAVPVFQNLVSVFGDVGSVKDKWQEMTTQNLYSDAGITVSLGPVRALFPVWINRPLEGEKRFDLRWKIGFGGSLGVKM